MINPSEIRLDSLPWVPLDQRKQLPAVPCIYFAIDSQGAVQYIGQTACLLTRWLQHHKAQELSRSGNVKIAYLVVPEVELLLEIETALIDWFAPPLNNKPGRVKKPAKRQNYKISFDLLAGLKGVARLEDRSDTAQLERWIREGVDRWKAENPSQVEALDELVSEFLSNEGVEEDA